jgi:1-acyl-sn-glycerol-3-phosphate acyltransferase
MWFLINVLQFATIFTWFLLPGAAVIYVLPKDTMYRFIRGAWSQWGLKIVGIRLKTEGQLPAAGKSPYMFLANHVSYGDIIILNVALPRPLHYIAKKELTKIPVLGRLMRKTDCVLVKRGFNKESRAVYAQAIEKIQMGLDLVVFPEGTRSRTGSMGPLRKGAFQMAIDAGAPIVPVAILGAAECWPLNNLSFRPGTVKVKIGSPIEVSGLTRDDTQHLMGKYLAEMQKLMS